MTITASCYSGCGNDFLIIDDREQWFPEHDAVFISKLCKEYGNVDGCILARRSYLADYQMLYFNNDGRSAAMCGNGVRSFMKYLKEKLHFPKEKCSIEIGTRLLQVALVGPDVRVEMGRVQELGWNIQLPFDECLWTLHYLNSGVPHLVTIVDDVAVIPVEKIGAYFRHHPQFQPAGANVNFIEMGTNKIRTFERGVEAETLACGTGVTATAWALHKLHLVPLPIRLQVRSQEWLEIDIKNDIAIMTGPATWIQDYDLTSSCR